jgi:hypothetical protein
MLRVVLALEMCVAALFVGGCASSAPPELEARRLAPATPVVTCTMTVEPENVCRVPKNCRDIGTCAEAHYRLVTCGHKWLDGAPRSGVPCQKVCGRTPEARDKQIAKEGGRGRDASSLAPPAPIRTCTLMHTALTLGA